MNNISIRSIREIRIHMTSLQFIFIVILVVGVFFRFVNLDRKVFWPDEAFTSLRASGYTELELVKKFNDNQIITPEDLKKYQRPSSEKSFSDTVTSLAAEEPQHPPLYFLMLRLWQQWFGGSVAVTRTLPAIASLLIFPTAYWLCLELFKSPVVGWVTIALLAVSPFHVLYAQDSRQYSLWTATTLLSCASLLWAIRTKSKFSWGMYAVSLALGLYTFLFTIFVTIAQGIYVIVIEKFRLTKTVGAYLLASISGLIAFTPWLWFVITGWSQVNQTTAGSKRAQVVLLPLIKEWVANLTRVFVDFISGSGLTSKNPLFSPSLMLLVLIACAICLLVAYSLYFLYRHAEKWVWLFILSLIIFTVLPVILPDLILGGMRSSVGRYFIPCILSIQLAVAYLLANKVFSISVNINQQQLWRVIAIALISSGVVSCAIISQAESWWVKVYNPYNPQALQIVNEANQPLLIVNSTAVGDVLTLGYKLNPHVKLQVYTDCYTCSVNSSAEFKQKNISDIPAGFSDVFLLDFGQELRDKFAQTYQVEPVELPAYPRG